MYQSGLKKNQDVTICCLKEFHFKYKDTDRLKVEKQRKIYHLILTEGKLE